MTAGYSVLFYQKSNKLQRDHLTVLGCLATPSLVLVVRFLCDWGLGSDQFLKFCLRPLPGIPNLRFPH